MPRPRASRRSAAAGAAYFAAGLAWVLLAGPPAPGLILAWFAVVAIAGAFLPGAANQVTLARAYLAAPGLVYAMSSAGLLPLTAVVTAAGLTDVLDGYLARRLTQVSDLGGALDPLVDGLCFGAVGLGLALGGTVPGWLGLVILLRYAIPAVAGAVLLLGGRRPRLRHTPAGQASTALIVVLLAAAALARSLGLEAALILAIAEIVIPVAAVATLANLAYANRAVFAAPAGGAGGNGGGDGEG